eukprot:CAMPEP_0198213644 /NCGR_PEP_ID=MMETSP1445-20131203/28986_1 /TAXON_ID=36898 /ORGANISM="Pyramimonas sp., Strain CCMP2087" /LENGTH=374 /DNA_ID=CAMNT_0043888319 /DNA_START=58 /DNA_END=1178 /DNA_ORIENTATION=+
MSESKTHGMATAIRALKDSEDFDLAGYDSAQVATLLTASFSSPIPLTAGTMIRVTFVIGGGKKVRQKYEETLARDLSMNLIALGYEDDRGASCCLECQGSFKYQHDTDKDLKFMHVFPKVEALPEEEKEEEQGGDLPAESMRGLLAAELQLFREMVNINAPSFIQKRSLMRVMKGVASRFEEFDKKLINNEQLEPAEQELYDRGVVISDKTEWLEQSLQQMITAGQLTKGEQLWLVADMQDKVPALAGLIEAQKEKGKKTEKLEAQLATVLAKVEAIAGIVPIPSRGSGVDNKELQQLRDKMKAMCKIESKKGLMNLDDSRELAKKPQIEERLKKMEAGDCAGWFDSKVKEVEALGKPKKKAAAPSKPKPVASG